MPWLCPATVTTRTALRTALGFSLLASVLAPACPSYERIANTGNPLVREFNMSRYLGHWYEIRSHNVPGLTTGCMCTRYNYTGNAGAWVEHLSCCKGRPTAKPSRYISNGRPTKDSQWPGEMQSSVDGLPWAAYWVLDIEAPTSKDSVSPYEYAWLYACTDIIGFKDEFVYFFSRNSSMPAALQTAWLTRAAQVGINTKDMKLINQTSECSNADVAPQKGAGAGVFSVLQP